MENKHECPVCPMEIRDLYATAHNFLVTLDSNDHERIPRKIASLRASVARMKLLVDAHFEATKAAKP